MKKTLNLLKILLPSVVVASSIISLTSCQQNIQVDISFIEVDKNLDLKSFFVPKNIENVEKEDLLKINSDITINKKVLEILQKTISNDITYQDFYLLNNADIKDEFDGKIDYHQIQNVQLTVYSNPYSSRIKGSFNLECNVIANETKISLDYLFNNLEIKDIPVEITDNEFNDDTIDRLSKDEWTKKHIFDILRTRLNYLDLNQINFNFSWDSSLKDEELNLEISPSKTEFPNITNNLFEKDSICKLIIQTTKYDHSYFDVSEIDFSDFYKENVQINTQTPDLIKDDEVISSIMETFSKASLADFINKKKNLNDKYKVFQDDVYVKFLNIPEKDSYIEIKTIELSISLNSKFLFNNAFTYVGVIGIDKLDDLSMIKPDKDVLCFEFEAKNPNVVELSEFFEISKYSDEKSLSNYVQKIINNKFNNHSELYFDYEIELAKPIDNMDFSKGKEVIVNVRATTFSKKLKNSFSFEIIGVVKNYLTNISDITCKSKETYVIQSNSQNSLSKLEFEKITKNEKLISFILSEIIVTKDFLYLSIEDFTIEAEYDAELDYFDSQNIEIAIVSSLGSHFIKGTFKTAILIKAEFKKFDLNEFDTSKAKVVFLTIPNPNEVIFSEAVTYLFTQKNFIDIISNVLANHVWNAIFGVDWDISIISIPTDISSLGYVKYQITSSEKSTKLIGEKYSTIPVLGIPGTPTVIDKKNNYSSGIYVNSGNGYVEAKDKRKDTNITYAVTHDFTFVFDFDYHQNKLWSDLNKTISMEYLLNNGIISYERRGLIIGVKDFSIKYTSLRWPGGHYTGPDSQLPVESNLTEEIKSGERIKLSMKIPPDDPQIYSFAKYYNSSAYVNLRLNKEHISFQVGTYAYLNVHGELEYMPKLHMINSGEKRENFLLEISEGPLALEFDKDNIFPENMEKNPYLESNYAL